MPLPYGGEPENIRDSQCEFLADSIRVGGFSDGCYHCVATAWVTQRTLSKRELVGSEIHTRESLYGEFIRACSKLVVDSFERTLDKPETLLPVY